MDWRLEVYLVQNRKTDFLFYLITRKMTIYFISGNKHKYEELKAVLSNLEMKSIDLPEIQETDPKAIIKAKLQEAMKYCDEPMIVEDTSLYFEAMWGKLPGPLIKRFVESIGSEGLVNLAQKLGNIKAIAKTVIGYAPNKDEMYFFEWAVEGEIVNPSVESAFGWDPIFRPVWYDQTFAEMGSSQKNLISQRRLAAEALLGYLGNEDKN